jgi:hypothetical protein
VPPGTTDAVMAQTGKKKQTTKYAVETHFSSANNKRLKIVPSAKKSYADLVLG